MDGLVLTPVYVYVRNILTQQWTYFTATQWADTYLERVSRVLNMHIESMGGELTLAGTPECGRVTLVHGDGDAVLADFDWYTLNLDQAMGLEPNGIPSQPQPQ